MFVPSSSSLLGPQPTAATGEAIGCHDSPEAVGLSTHGKSELEGNDLKSTQAPPHDPTTGEPLVGGTARHPASYAAASTSSPTYRPTVMPKSNAAARKATRPRRRH